MVSFYHNNNFWKSRAAERPGKLCCRNVAYTNDQTRDSASESHEMSMAITQSQAQTAGEVLSVDLHSASVSAVPRPSSSTMTAEDTRTWLVDHPEKAIEMSMAITRFQAQARPSTVPRPRASYHGRCTQDTPIMASNDLSAAQPLHSDHPRVLPSMLRAEIIGPAADAVQPPARSARLLVLSCHCLDLLTVCSLADLRTWMIWIRTWMMWDSIRRKYRNSK